MEYHAVYRDDKAIIRQANDGINEIEWEHGCRIIQVSYKQLTDATNYVKRLGYEMLNSNEWNEYISELDDPSNVPNNNYINAYPVLDKWDGGKSY